MAWQIGVDVGGTFTDLLALDPERGTFRVAKVPSTPEDQSVGFIGGIRQLFTVSLPLPITATFAFLGLIQIGVSFPAPAMGRNLVPAAHGVLRQ